MKTTMTKKGCFSIAQKLTKELLTVTNTSKKILSELQMHKQIKLCIRSILSQQKDKLLGGGGCCSKQEINFTNLNQIKIDEELSNNNHQNNKFEQEYKVWTKKETILQSIEKDTQLAVQKHLLKKCIADQIIESDEQINLYQSEISEIFETYLLLEVTRVSNKSEFKQEEFSQIFNEVKQIESFVEDYPIKELVFYVKILTDLNEANYKFEEMQKKDLFKIKEFVNRILKFKKNEDFSVIISSHNDIKQNLHIFDKNKELFPLKYQIEIWLRKIEQFREKFKIISEEEEILFYVKYFLEIINQQNSADQVIFTLIRINFILEKFQKEKSQLPNKMQIYEQFSHALIKANIHQFLNELIQKQDKFTNQVFLILSVENQDYRYITLSILLSINSIFTIAFQNMQNQEYLLEFLCNKYLTEQEQAIRVVFEKSNEFVLYFNENIKNQIFMQKIMKFDQLRKQKLQPLLPQLKNYERSINSFDDIIKLITDNAIQKWERDIKKRQRQNIAQKDDVLLEVRDLYINQMITYLNGNHIFENSKQIDGTLLENSNSQQNALQIILKLFLIPYKQNSLKYVSNQSAGNDVKDGNKIENQQNLCQILGILAEGGTGKSMLMKKIETQLIENITKLNVQSETQNYLPILVKCNALDQKNPSLCEYLKQQGINEDMLRSLKQNEKHKVILLDGYDEYTGDYFTIYSTLKINEWNNTKIIVATRKEKLSERDACQYFSKQNELGQIDEMSYCLVQLEEFTQKDMHEYAERYFKQERKKDQISLIEKDLKNLRDCLTNVDLEKLLHLPINLYLFTRMLVNLDDKNFENLKSKVSDQIGIQEIFFSDQFEREAQSFIDAYISDTDFKSNKNFRTSIKNCYFDYFQTIAMQMFKNKGIIEVNYLKIEKQKINYNLSQSVIKILNEPQIVSLKGKIKNYINSKIITRVKSEQQRVKILQTEQEQQFVEFKHKSLYEYFVARAMKNDFDEHGEKIYTLKMEELEQFNINQKSIMNMGSNQSEQQILMKLYKLIKSQIESDDFYQNYHQNEIEENNRYIQYLKRSQIQTSTDLSKIDIGASNLISALFISKFSYRRLKLSLCSLSKAYLNSYKSNEIVFDRCNFKHAFLQNSHIDFDSNNTEQACFNPFQKTFQSTDIYSVTNLLWGKNNLLFCTTRSGFICVFKIMNQGIQLLKSKKISQNPLFYFLYVNDNTFLISTRLNMFLINSNNFQIYYTHTFTQLINFISLIEENVVVVLSNQTTLIGTFKDGFQKFNNIGNFQGCGYNKSNQILVSYQNEQFSIWNMKKKFEFIKTIKGHDKEIMSVVFSEDGKYLATISLDSTCKIWNTEKEFELINIIQGHSDLITNVAFSADGMYLATGSKDTTCKIWNIQKDFELFNTIKGHNLQIRSVNFSTDGKFLSTCCNELICKIWSKEKDFELNNSIQGHTGEITCVAFSIDGKHLATGSYDQTCKIWDLKNTSELVNTIQGHSDLITSIHFSPDGQYLATGSQDTTCKIWNTQNGFGLINTISGHTSAITSVVFSADGKNLITGSKDGTCKIWNSIVFELIHTIQGQQISSMAYSVNGKYLATGSNDKICKIWNPQMGFELIHTIQDQSITSVAFSVNEKYLAIGSGDKTCKIWNAEKGFELIHTISGHTEDILSVVFSADGKYLATGSDDTTCKVWNVQKDFELINTIEQHYEGITSVSFSPDGKYLATASKDYTWTVWNAENVYESINAIQEHSNMIMSVAFSADGKYLATGSYDKTCKIWNAQKGFELINTIQSHTGGINSVAFSSDNKYLATGSYDKTCKIWNAQKDFKLINIIQGHTLAITSVSFSVNGKYLVTGSLDSTYKIWHIEKNFELINIIQGQSDQIASVAFSVDGKYLATSSKDTSCKIWNIQKDFELFKTILGHSDLVTSVTFSADGKYLVTGSKDTTCKIWNAEKGFEFINTIQGHKDLICSISFSSDVKYLITVSENGVCKIWNVEKSFELISTLNNMYSFITSVAFSANGKYLATGYLSNTIKIWNIQNSFKLKDIIDSASKVEISQDNKYIFVEQMDKNCKIYDLETIQIMFEEGKDKAEEIKQKYKFEHIQPIDYQNIILFYDLYGF